MTYQLKLLTTALFSVLLLRKQLSELQWFSLFLLFIGIGVVQLQPQKTASSSSPASKVVTSSSSEVREQNGMLGLSAVLAACIMSGFAGVYFEKLLKHTSPSIYLRNIQLGLIGVVFGLCAAFYNDGQQVRSPLTLSASLSCCVHSLFSQMYNKLYFNCCLYVHRFVIVVLVEVIMIVVLPRR